MSWAALLLAAAPLLQVELRWVDQPLVPAGVLSSAGQSGGLSTRRDHGVTPLGAAQRVASGQTLAWSLRLPPDQPRRHGDAAWQLEASPQWQGEGRPLRLRLRWQQPLGELGSQAGQSELLLAEGHWVSLLRDAPPAALPDGALRTQASPRVRELQVRVTRLPE